MLGLLNKNPAANLASVAYQERQRMVEWERRQQAQAAYQSYRQGERAEPPKTPTPTPTPTSVNPPVPPPPTPPMPQGTSTPTATPTPMPTLTKIPPPVPAPTPPASTPTAIPASAPQVSKPWWEQAKDWLQDKVEKFVYHPPSWLSVSYSRPFSLGNATVDEWVSYQPWARGGDLLRSVGYQKVSIGLESTTKLTSNPSGRVEVNFSNGRLTFKGTEQNGIRQDWFVQPFALSFGHVTHDLNRSQLNVTTVDIDLIGPNWASVKVSQASGSVTTQMTEDGKFASTTTTLGKVDISVHRYPRLVAIAGGLVLLFKVGVALAPALAPAIPLLQSAVR